MSRGAQALQSMFQLIMQEGWSEVMSEVMCHKPLWLLINFYFICLHLFASLVGVVSLSLSLSLSQLSRRPLESVDRSDTQSHAHICMQI